MHNVFQELMCFHTQKKNADNYQTIHGLDCSIESMSTHRRQKMQQVICQDFNNDGIISKLMASLIYYILRSVVCTFKPLNVQCIK